MAHEFNLEVPPELRLEAAGFGLESLEADHSIIYMLSPDLRIRHIPVRWQSSIAVWDPPQRFVDEQIRGPYRVWIHEHRFIEKAGGTLCEDSVQYAPLGGAFINRLLVERDIRKIFAYRSDRLQKFFPELREEELSARNYGDVVAASDATHRAA